MNIKKGLRSFAFIVVSLVLILVFRNWFLFYPLSSGDWTYNWLSTINEFAVFPSVWNTHFAGGIGGAIPFILGLETFFLATSKLLSLLGLSWILIERLIWFWPYLTLSFFSSYFLFKSFFKISFYSVLASLIFVTNTYALMLVSGGQMGVAMAYAISPFVLGCFVRFSNENKYLLIKSNFLESIFLGVLLAVISMYDVRIAYVVLTALFLYSVVMRPFTKKIFFRFLLFVFLIPGTVIFLLNAFWLIPLFFMRDHASDIIGGSAYSSIESVRFFSFAKFENSFSLLHPNWPENIFGKVSFLRSEFLIIPILAFTSLLFALKDKKNYKIVGFLSILGMFGAFLSKGTNEPFGKIYEILFLHFPGFFMFRDSTKWYLLIIISYSLLIPFSLEAIALFLKKSLKVNRYIVFLLFIILWGFLIREAIMGDLPGTFAKHAISSDYSKLEKMISSDTHFYRTFWMPSTQRYGAYSETHPWVYPVDFWRGKNEDYIKKTLKSDTSKQLFYDSAIKYVVVPEDSQGEIFLNDRKYSKIKRNEYVSFFENIKWLKRVNGFSNIDVFETKSYSPKFRLENEGMVIYRRISASSYELQLQNVKKGETLFFSERFDKWKLTGENGSIFSEKNTYFNAFRLPQSGSYKVLIEYDPQKWVVIGAIISLVSAVGILAFLGFWKRINF